MYSIGKKIKELRQKNDMTQERLADFLCVSYQAVSKWECGMSNPDLSLIASIARLFHITTDELLGLCEPEADERRAMFDNMCERSGETMSIEEELAMAADAVSEYPGELQYLNWLGIMHCKHAWMNEKPEHINAEYDEAVRCFQTVIECTEEEKMKESAVFGIVNALTNLGRYDEARDCAELYPDDRDISKKAVIEMSLPEGVDKKRVLQELVIEHLDGLMFSLERLHRDKGCLDIAEAVLRAFFTDENFLNYWEHMRFIHQRRAEDAVRFGECDIAIAELRLALECAVKSESIDGVRSYTSPALCLLRYDAEKKDSIRYFVEEAERCMPLRERDDYKALIAEAKEFAQRPFL